MSSVVLAGDPCRVGSGCIGRDASAKLAARVAWWVPLPEALESSTSPSSMLSRVILERLFCPEVDGNGPSDGRQGKVLGVRSTSSMSRSVCYSENSSSKIRAMVDGTIHEVTGVGLSDGVFRRRCESCWLGRRGATINGGPMCPEPYGKIFGVGQLCREDTRCGVQG